MTFEPSKSQKEVMRWVGQGWSAWRYNHQAVEINGKRICNVPTMTVLERAGMVQCHRTGDVWEWTATDAGREFTQLFILRG